MELLHEIYIITLRGICSIGTLFVLSRIQGPRQIAQLTYYDYTVGISIGSIAALALDDEFPFHFVIIGLVVYGGFTLLLSWLSLKSMTVRRLVEGKPNLVIYQGKIINSALKKKFFDLNELLLQCRLNGYFDISEIDYAVIETNGQLTILPKSENKVVTLKDLQINTDYSDLQYNLVLDGVIMTKILNIYGKTEKWLLKELKKQKVSNPKECFLVTGNSKFEITIYKKDETNPPKDFFI